MITHMRLIQRVCEAHAIHPTTNDHGRFAHEYPTLFKSVGMIGKGKLMHPAEVMPIASNFGRICAEFVNSAFNTPHNDVRADYNHAATERIERSNVYHLIQSAEFHCPVEPEKWGRSDLGRRIILSHVRFGT